MSQSLSLLLNSLALETFPLAALALAPLPGLGQQAPEDANPDLVGVVGALVYGWTNVTTGAQMVLPPPNSTPCVSGLTAGLEQVTPPCSVPMLQVRFVPLGPAQTPCYFLQAVVYPELGATLIYSLLSCPGLSISLYPGPVYINFLTPSPLPTAEITLVDRVLTALLLTYGTSAQTTTDPSGVNFDRFVQAYPQLQPYAISAVLQGTAENILYLQGVAYPKSKAGVAWHFGLALNDDSQGVAGALFLFRWTAATGWTQVQGQPGSYSVVSKSAPLYPLIVAASNS